MSDEDMPCPTCGGPLTIITEPNGVRVTCRQCFPEDAEAGPTDRLVWLDKVQKQLVRDLKVEAVRLHSHGMSWTAIGKVFGISRQAAWERFTR